METYTKVKEELNEVISEIENFEIDEDDYEDKFNRYLHNEYGEIIVRGNSMTPWEFLETLDVINYELKAWVDDTATIEEDERYIELLEQKEEIEVRLTKFDNDPEYLKTVIEFQDTLIKELSKERDDAIEDVQGLQNRIDHIMNI